MDLNDIRVIVTVVSFVTFIGIIVWAYSGRRQAGFQRAARSVLEESDEVGNAGREGRG